MKLQFLEAGEIVTTHGIRGDVKVLPWGDSPEFLMDFNRVRIDGTDYIVELKTK
jgi:16S rRNA processing protein RimM